MEGARARALVVFRTASTVLALGACASQHTAAPHDGGFDAEQRVGDASIRDCCRSADATDDDDDASAGDDAAIGPGEDASAIDAWRDLGDAAALPEDASRRPDDSGRIDAGLCDTWPGGSIDVLFIGNSQIDVSDLASVVATISRSAPAGCVRIVSERFTLGGANLRDLWEMTLPDGRRLEPTIASGRYEVVVIAESIDLAELVPTPFPALFVDYATRIITASRAAGSIPLLYATPYIDAPDRSGFHAMADPQLAMGAEMHVGVAAGGLAWLRVWDERPDLDLHAADHAHPGCLGTYVSALVLWAAITGGNPIGLDYSLTIFSDTGACPPISATDADLFQRAAWAQQLATGP